MTTNDLPFFGNGGGSCKTVEDVAKLCRAPVTHIEVGSITALPRNGNTGNVFYCDLDGTTYNALGMPNGGIRYYRRYLPEMLALARNARKELIVNIAAIDPGDTEKLCRLCVEAGVRYITYNGGCPNVWVQGKQKRIVSFDPEALAKEIGMVFGVIGGADIQVIGKLSPFAGEYALRSEVADVLRPYPCIIATCNTLPNQSGTSDRHAPVISAVTPDGQNIHIGGMGGTALRGYAVRELDAFRPLLPNHRIISIGGISRGSDLLERLELGAYGVQITSAYYANGDLHIFSEVLAEYAALTE